MHERLSFIFVAHLQLMISKNLTRDVFQGLAINSGIVIRSVINFFKLPSLS